MINNKSTHREDQKLAVNIPYGLNLSIKNKMQSPVLSSHENLSSHDSESIFNSNQGIKTLDEANAQQVANSSNRLSKNVGFDNLV